MPPKSFSGTLGKFVIHIATFKGWRGRGVRPNVSATAIHIRTTINKLDTHIPNKYINKLLIIFHLIKKNIEGQCDNYSALVNVRLTHTNLSSHSVFNISICTLLFKIIICTIYYILLNVSSYII